MQARTDNPEVWSFPFDFEENPIHAWEAAFASYQRDSAEIYSLSIDLAAVVDNRVFPGDWARPAMRGITVNHKTVVKTTYGANPRLAKSITERAWSTLEARIHSRDCCAIGECGLDYREPAHSLPGQRQLFQQQVTLAHQLKKPLVLHLRGNNRLSMSDVMRETAAILRDNTHPNQWIHVHCYTGSLLDYQHSVGEFPNSVFGITHKSAMAAGLGELACRIDLYRLVLETDSPLLSPHGLACGHPYELISQAQMIAEHRNLPSWVILRVAALNAQTCYQV